MKRTYKKHVLRIERFHGITSVKQEMSEVTEEDMWNSTCNYYGAESTYIESNTDRYVSMVREKGVIYTGSYSGCFIDNMQDISLMQLIDQIL